MKLRDWSIGRWLLVGAVILALPLVAVRLHLKWRVHQAVEELRAAGQPTRYAELVVLYPPVPADQNLVTLLTNAWTTSPVQSYREGEVQTIPLYGGPRLPAPGADWPVQMRKDVALFLAGRSEELATYRLAVERSKARCCVPDWPHGEHWLGNLSKTKGATRLLQLEAAFALEERDGPRAFTAIETMLNINHSLLEDPLITVHLVMAANNSMTMEALTRYLGSDLATREDMSRLRKLIESGTRDQAFAKALASERVAFLETYLHGSDPVHLLLPTGPLTRGRELMERVKVVGYRMLGLADADILAYLRFMDGLEHAANNTAKDLHRISTNWTAHLEHAGLVRLRIWSRSSLLLYDKILVKELRSQTSLSAAEAILAVAQYRLQHDGKLPGSLGELVPEFLEAVPVEPQSDKPFELIVTADGYGIGRGTPVFTVKLNGARQEPLPTK